jgi:transposase-like protein
MISLPRLSPRFPVFLQMARNQASPLQHGSMGKIKIASVNVMQQNGIKRKDLLRITNKPI